MRPLPRRSEPWPFWVLNKCFMMTTTTACIWGFRSDHKLSPLCAVCCVLCTVCCVLCTVCCMLSSSSQKEPGSHPSSRLPVCQLLLEVPALPQELSAGGYYPTQNREHLKFKYLECQHLQHKHCLIHNNPNYSLLQWNAGFWESKLTI